MKLGRLAAKLKAKKDSSSDCGSYDLLAARSKRSDYCWQGRVERVQASRHGLPRHSLGARYDDARDATHELSYEEIVYADDLNAYIMHKVSSQEL